MGDLQAGNIYNWYFDLVKGVLHSKYMLGSYERSYQH